MKKYTLRKIGKRLLPVAFGIVVVSIAGLTGEVSAKEGAGASVVETVTTEKTEVELDTINSEVKKQEEVTNNSKTELDNATKEVEEKEKEVAEAEKLNAEATEENKYKVREDIVNKEEVQTTKDNSLDNKKQEKTNKEAEITNQQLALDTATNNVENKEKEKEETKKEVDKVQAILDGTNSNQIIDALEKSTKQVEQDKKDLALSNQELDNAKESDRQRAEEITQATTEKEQAQTEAERTNTELQEATTKKEETATTLFNAKKEVEKAQANFNGINKITLTQEYIENLKKAFDFNITRKEREQAELELKRINEDLKSLNNYKVNTNDDNTTLLDVNNLSEEVRKELSLLASDLVNQIRKQMGTEKTTVTSSVLDFANKVANHYEQDNWSIWLKFTHNDEKIKLVAGEYGLPKGQYYENLAGILGTNKLTYSKLKESVYNAIVGFMLNGKEYLHAQSVAGINWGTSKEQYIGLDFSNVLGKNQLHLITVDKDKVEKSTTNNFNIAEIINENTPEKISKILKEKQELYNISKQNDDNAQAILSRVQESNNIAINNLKEKTTNLLNLEAKPLLTPQAQEKVNALETKLVEDTRNKEQAQSDYDKLNSNVKEKQRKLSEAKQLLAEKEKELAQSKAQQKEEQEKLNTLTKELNVINTELDNLNKALATAKKELVDAKYYLEKLNNAPVSLEEVKENLKTAQENLAQAEIKYTVEQEKLTKLKELQKEKQELYDKLKAEYDKEKARLRQIELEKQSAEQKELEQEKSTKQETNVEKEQQKEVKKLSNTGDNSINTTGLALATTLVSGLLVNRRRKN